MSFLPHSIDQCKSESQPRNKLHILMRRIAIVDTVIYCPDPCSKTKTLFLHPPEALATDGSQRVTSPPPPPPLLPKELSSAKESFLNPGYISSPGPLQSTGPDILPQKKNASQGLFHIQNFCEID